jgi:UDP-sugar transporter A1/2/3
MYISSTAVVMMEIVKFICCSCVLLATRMSLKEYVIFIVELFTKNWNDTRMMLVPSGLYAIQNNVLYLAISYLNAVVFQVTYQLKILTTAFFSVVILRRNLNPLKWLALILLTFGVILVQFPSEKTKKSSNPNPKEALAVTESENAFIGLIAVSLACLSSGFAGVYFEKLVKQQEANLWIRNIQLGIFTLVFSILAMVFQDGRAIYTNGFFYGYNVLIWTVIFLQAAGGLIVALVMKYADNIVKAFATSISIIVSMFIVFIRSDFTPNISFLIGTAAVLISVYLYSK